MRCKSLLSTFPTRNNVRFLHGYSKTQQSAKAQAVHGCAARLDFRHVPQLRITRVFQNPRHASTMKQVCDGSIGGSNFGRGRTKCVVVKVTSFCNKGLCHVVLGTKLRVEYIATQTQMIRRSCQEGRSTEHVKQITFQSSLAVALSTIPRHVARVFPICFGAGEGESGVTDFV